MRISDLKRYQFERVGSWDMKGGKITFHLAKYQTEKVIYAFTLGDEAVDGEVKYIGKTTTTLYQRMSGYKNPNVKGRQLTNMDVNKEIKNALKKGHDVVIYALKPPVYKYIEDIEVDSVEGLEGPFIKKCLTCTWNKNKKSNVGKSNRSDP